jgi:broad specificity phosphatase PhoE
MTKIVLTRHGHVEGIKPQRFRGRAELPLTARGIAQAKTVAKRIAAGWNPVIIYTSPMGRCVATAEFIAQCCKVPVERLDELNDLDYGAWQGRSHEEVRKARPKLLSAWYETPHLVRFPGDGDSLQDLVARTADALRLILDRHPDETVVAVGHDSVNRALLMQLIDQPLSSYWRITQTPCCLNEIEIVDGKVRVLRINETRHLAEAE